MCFADIETILSGINLREVTLLGIPIQLIHCIEFYSLHVVHKLFLNRKAAYFLQQQKLCQKDLKG